MIKLPIDWGKFELCHRCFAEPGEPCMIVEPGRKKTCKTFQCPNNCFGLTHTDGLCTKIMKLPHYRRTFTHNGVKVSIPFTSEAVTAESFRQARELPRRLSSMRS